MIRDNKKQPVAVDPLRPQLTPHVDVAALSLYLAAQPDIVVAYLYGSVARGQANALSDVDIAVLLDKSGDAEAMLERQIRLTTELARFSDRDVQVTILNQAPPLLAYQVVRDGLLLFEQSRSQRIDFEVQAMKRYFDVKPMLDFLSEQMRKRIREVGLGRRSQRGERTVEVAERIRERLAQSAGR